MQFNRSVGAMKIRCRLRSKTAITYLQFMANGKEIFIILWT